MNKRYYKYDKHGNAIFFKNSKGDEIYLRDKKTGDEIYPAQGNPFAMNHFGLEYYAKSSDGDEKYPIRNNKCIPIYRSRLRNVIIFPRQLSGREIYPSNKYGDEYYFFDQDNKPVLLKDENGNKYFAQTRTGVIIIPHKYFIEEYEQKPETRYYLGVDGARNVVHSEGVKISQSGLFECVCTVIITIPYTVCDCLPFLTFCVK